MVMEAAVSTIIDMEDSVAAVDAEDKALVYRNWLGLMKGTLSADLEKGGKIIERRLNPDRLYTAPDGGELRLHGRSLMLIRNVGHAHVHRRGARRRRRAEMPEGLLDAAVSVLIAMHDLDGKGAAAQQPHRLGLHRQAENARARTKWRSPARLFARVEDVLGLPRNTIKMGIMDEERRTTVNLNACIRAASERVVFINTGFLDRTGDEIHTSMEAGPMIRKNDMRRSPGSRPTRTGTSTSGLALRPARPRADRQGHVGGARPDGRHAGAEDRPSAGRRHHRLGALAHRRRRCTRCTITRSTCSPRQKELAGRTPAKLADILTMPVSQSNLAPDAVQQEIDNNARAFWATSCAGSTRASAAPRCPTSTTSA